MAWATLFACRIPTETTPLVNLRSVRVRLMLGNVLGVAVALCLMCGVIRYTLEATLYAGIDRTLVRIADSMQHMAQDRFGAPPGFGNPGGPHGSDLGRPFLDHGPGGPSHPNGGPSEPPRPNNAGAQHTGGGRRGPSGPNEHWRARFLDTSGHSHGPPDMPDGPIDAAAFVRGLAGETLFTTRVIDGEKVRIYTGPVRRDDAINGVIQVGRSRTEANIETIRLTKTMLLVSPLALVLSALFGIVLTSRALSPVRRITHAASAIGATNLSDRLPVDGHDEFGELSATFNGMLARLDQSFKRLEGLYEQQRRFTADASHELRTPLTVIKANSSLALSHPGTPEQYCQTLEAIDKAADLSTRIVQDLLMLARADADELKLTPKPVALLDIITRAEALSAGAGAAPVAICDDLGNLTVTGDSDSLVRLFSNLITNAVRHTPYSGQVAVCAESVASTVIVTVSDSGEGIAPEHLPHLFERFYRVDSARSRARGGVGLGLAISKTIVDAHGGTIAIDSTMGKGTTVRVILPQ